MYVDDVLSVSLHSERSNKPQATQWKGLDYGRSLIVQEKNFEMIMTSKL
jgi:hypothetical protein